MVKNFVSRNRSETGVENPNDLNFTQISSSSGYNGAIGWSILPVNNDDMIELRVGWLFNIPGPVYYKIYIDVMTGEIIGQEPTIIS